MEEPWVVCPPATHCGIRTVPEAFLSKLQGDARALLAHSIPHGLAWIDFMNDTLQNLVELGYYIQVKPKSKTELESLMGLDGSHIHVHFCFTSATGWMTKGCLL